MRSFQKTRKDSARTAGRRSVPKVVYSFPVARKSGDLTPSRGSHFWLDTTRQTLLNYEGRADFLDTITAAKLKIENYAAERLFDPHAPTRGVIFSLSNNSRD